MQFFQRPNLSNLTYPNLFLPYQPNLTRSNLNLTLPNPTRPDLTLHLQKSIFVSQIECSFFNDQIFQT